MDESKRLYDAAVAAAQDCSMRFSADTSSVMYAPRKLVEIESAALLGNACLDLHARNFERAEEFASQVG
jgi:hypothetical protein